MRFLEESLTHFGVEAESPVQAIREAGRLLVNAGTASESYIEAMLHSFEKNGPYFVIAPHIALPHARPEDGVIEASVSMIQLKNPVKFGHQANDPVRLVFAIGASSSEDHLELLQKISTLLSNQENVKKLGEAKCYETIQELIGGI
ncbi:PTS sugar transporter subunit IIA [Paenactinomyces guangxiensis]|uniref:PTS sugar transporter subunit IIA n=1 Tax=Paenactinomyces guangxiensis TaxID=1490290 RepID=A0A7W1WP91_9BACL|nr:PTS sugar transporter subunit IIA [Paenactinomyces guangxiensis]MBA4493536.1 PTS sugar transporter subunit IIA [Paenactinomyces guangxiensis]MBH8590627.1 PTS sugar transporter subunit IIA [Paenactinomyces guangxiensis]